MFRHPDSLDVPLRNFALRRPRRPATRSSRTPAGRPRPVITKVVIYITLDIWVNNVPRASEGIALPALCTGKPITAVVVAF
jgi:hypothetical protein